MTRDLVVAGGSTSVPSDAVAVVLNMTATGGSGASHLTVWPAGETMPVASSLNFGAGEAVPNAVTVKVGAAGAVSVFNNSGSVDVVADVVGYYSTGSGGVFVPVSPKRLLDSRDGTGGYSTPWGPGQSRSVTAVGASTGIPESATAVVLNTTGFAPTSWTHLTVWPAGETMPVASSLNLPTGDARANLVITKVGTADQVSIFNNSGNIDVIADVAGYYT